MKLPETPRDWSNIILFLPENGNSVIQGYWDCDAECFRATAGLHTDNNDEVDPSLWMPLPSAPETIAQQGTG